MEKRMLFTLLSIGLLITGAILFVIFTPRQKDSSPLPMNLAQEEVADDIAPPVNTIVKDGNYTEYSLEKVLATSGIKLLFFHAEWCPQCRAIEESIEAEGLPKNVTVFKIDYDTNQVLRQQYGVTLQTTFVKVDDKGDKIASYVAYEEPRFSSVERELLR